MTSITVIIPAYNEAGNLPGTLQEVVPLISRHFEDYEILIFDDCSSDETGKIAEEAALQNSKIKTVRNPKNMGLGYNYKTGVKMAAKDFILMVPGDNEITSASYERMFEVLKEGKDMVIPYTVNTEIRPMVRRFFSKAYTMLINALFGLRVKYFNGPVIHKRSLIQSVVIETDGFAYQTEALIKLLRQGRTYAEAGMFLKERGYGKSKAFNLRNIYRVLKTVSQLWADNAFKK